MREYADPWYARNRHAVIARQHKRYSDAIQRLTPDELAECQRDPTKVWTIRGPKWIACILHGCGELHEQLGHHLRVRHQMTAAAYKAQPGADGITPTFSKGASLLCVELRERLSKKRKKLRLGKRLQKSGTVPPVEKLIASRKKRVLSQQYRIEQGRRKVGGRPDLWGKWHGESLLKRGEVENADWKIAELVADGWSDEEIASKIGLKHGASVGARRKKIGFENARKPRVYDHGRVLRVADLRRIAQDLGKSLRQMADDMGLNYETLKSGASAGYHENPLSTLIGRAFKKRMPKWRSEYRHRPSSADGGRPQLLLPSERHKMRAEYKDLLPLLKRVLKYVEQEVANERAVDLVSMRSWVFLQARKGQLRRLALWPSFFGWIRERNLVRSGFKPFLLAYEFLASEYGVSVGTIRDATRPEPA
jgi:hypothetical protein